MIISNVSQSGLLELEKFLRSPVHIFHSAYKSFFIIIDEGLHKRCGQRACRCVLVPSYTASLPSVLIYVILSERFNQLYFTSYSIVLRKKFYHIALNAFASRFAKKGQGLMKCLEPQNCWIAEAA